MTWQATGQPAQAWIDFPHAAQTMRLTRDRHDHATGHKSREQVYIMDQDWELMRLRRRGWLALTVKT